MAPGVTANGVLMDSLPDQSDMIWVANKEGDVATRGSYTAWLGSVEAEMAATNHDAAGWDAWFAAQAAPATGVGGYNNTTGSTFTTGRYEPGQHGHAGKNIVRGPHNPGDHPGKQVMLAGDKGGSSPQGTSNGGDHNDRPQRELPNAYSYYLRPPQRDKESAHIYSSGGSVYTDNGVSIGSHYSLNGHSIVTRSMYNSESKKSEEFYVEWSLVAQLVSRYWNQPYPEINRPVKEWGSEDWDLWFRERGAQFEDMKRTPPGNGITKIDDEFGVLKGEGNLTPGRFPAANGEGSTGDNFKNLVTAINAGAAGAFAFVRGVKDGITAALTEFVQDVKDAVDALAKISLIIQEVSGFTFEQWKIVAMGTDDQIRGIASEDTAKFLIGARDPVGAAVAQVISMCNNLLDAKVDPVQVCYLAGYALGYFIGNLVKGTVMGVAAAGIAKVINKIGDMAGKLFGKSGEKIAEIQEICKKPGYCFIAGTLVLAYAMSSRPAKADTHVEPSRYEATVTAPTAVEDQVTCVLAPIEQVRIGSRVPSQNPDPLDYDFSLPEPDEDTWRKVDISLKRLDGAAVHIELIRPARWIDDLGLTVGAEFSLLLNDIAVDGHATVTAIEPCPPIDEGPGSVVTGRFTTRQVADLLTVTLADGTEFTGTTRHNVWLPEACEWRSIEDLQPGDLVDTINGLVTVRETSLPGFISDVYNIEVHGHHVYRITQAGVLVHNSGPKGGCPVAPGDEGTYGELKNRKKKSGETEPLDMDHQPSFAAQVAALEEKLGRPLTPAELRDLKKTTPAIASPRKIHQETSPTYGGRNTKEQIREDIQDLDAARARDRAEFDRALRERERQK